jgi:hypothetical protein
MSLRDSYHTLSPLRHTPQSICIAAIFVVSLLLKGSETPAKGVAAESDVAEEKLKSEIQLVNTRLSKPGPWEAALGVTVAQIESTSNSELSLMCITLTSFFCALSRHHTRPARPLYYSWDAPRRGPLNVASFIPFVAIGRPQRPHNWVVVSYRRHGSPAKHDKLSAATTMELAELDTTQDRTPRRSYCSTVRSNT